MSPPDLALAGAAADGRTGAGPAIEATATTRPPRVLYAPVAGGEGSGERVRCEAVAAAVARHAPGAVQALAGPVAPGLAELDWLRLPASPTRAPAQLAEAIDRFRPDWLVFDSNARTAVLRHARRQGIGTVFIASRPRAVRRALSLQRPGRFDEVWLVEALPPVGMAALLRQLRRALSGRSRVTRWSSLHLAPDPGAAARRLASLGLAPGEFLLSCPGGGGYRRDGLASGEWLAQAAALAGARLGLPVLALAAPAAPAGTHRLDRVEQPELLALAGLARAALVGGGSLLVQAVTEGVPCVAVPWQAEQQQRVLRMARQDLACAAGASLEATAACLQRLAADPALRLRRQRAIAMAGLGNGLPEAATMLARLPALHRDADGRR